MRTKKIMYKGSILKSRVSPLELLITNVNKVATFESEATPLATICPNSPGALFDIEHVAVPCEIDGSRETRNFVRTSQRMLSLALLEKLEFERPRNYTRLRMHDLLFVEKYRDLLTKQLAELKKLKSKITVKLVDDCGIHARFELTEDTSSSK